jgi:phosphoesterase RecJ-like protein
VRPVSAATKKAVRPILDFIRKHKRFLCSGHVRSDGDALGAQLALNVVLKKLKKQSHAVCDHGALPDYRFLPGAEAVGADPSALKPPYDAVVTCDSGAWKRLERISAAIDRSKTVVINIDHHASNERFGDINWIDPSYSSTGEMIWDLMKAARVRPSPEIATCCYVASVTDTGRFMFSNTTTETHRNAAEMIEAGVKPAVITKLLWRQKKPEQLKMSAEVIQSMRLSDDGRIAWIAITPAMMQRTGWESGDTQEFMDLMMSLKTVECAILFRSVDGRVKVSWRTGPGINGIELARRHGGGGHPRASGASLDGPLEDVERRIVAESAEYLRTGKRLTEKEEEAIAKM